MPGKSFSVTLTLVAKSISTACNAMVYSPSGSSVHGILCKNTRVGCHFYLQGIFLTQGLNPPLLHFLHWPASFFTTSATWKAHKPWN